MFCLSALKTHIFLRKTVCFDMAAIRSLKTISFSAGLCSRILLSNAFNSTVHISSRSIRVHPLAAQTLRSVKLDAKEIPSQETVYDNSDEENLVRNEIVSKVNSQIANKSHGRLFAVVHLANHQWKITQEDVLLVEGNWPPAIGDVIRLEKVLLVGSSDFTLVGMPLLRPDLVNIQATVLEKRLSHTRTSFFYIPRKQTKTTNFYRKQETVLRINSIELGSLLNKKADFEGLEDRIF